MTSDAATLSNSVREAEIISALRTIEDLKGLSDEEFAWIAKRGTERLAKDGELIFSQADPPHHLMFLLRGCVFIRRHTSSPVSVLVGQTGRVTGATPFSRLESWNADGRSYGETWILQLHESFFPSLLNAITSMTQRIVRHLLDRNREYTKAEQQIGKLAAVNKLAASLAHELNNPASAAKRAASLLMQSLEAENEAIRYRLGAALGSRLDAYLQWLSRLRSNVRASRQPEAGSAEDDFAAWLESRQYPQSWQLAPLLADCNIPLSSLRELESLVPEEAVALALGDLLASLSSDRAILTVSEAAEKIVRLVTAVKDFSYMDRQPVQDVDIAQSLDTVLLLYQPRLRGISVKRSYAGGIPALKAFGSELNQAWSALIENALDAMGESGTLTLSTKLQGATILVEISNTGPAIPDEYKDRVFEPFFTTKAFGTGLGLGLDIVQRVLQRHFGAVAFESNPGKTTFYVRLPLDRDEVR
jgi:signal transduction histidine kinase